MQQKHIFIFFISIFSFALVGLFFTFAQDASGIVCKDSNGNTTAPISQTRCGYMSGFQMTCPSDYPWKLLVYPYANQGPYYVDCVTTSALAALQTVTCSAANGATYLVNNRECATGDTAIGCPSGKQPLGQMCTSSSSSSPSPSPSPSSIPSHDIVCADPASRTQSENQYCMVWSKSQTIALWCTYAGEAIRREGSKEVCIPSAQIKSTEKKCSFENMSSHKQIEIYAVECPATAPPPPPPTSKTTDIQKAPTLIPEPEVTEPTLQCPATKGLCRKGKVQECLAVCPASWEFVLPEGYTRAASRLLGEDYVTGVSSAGVYLEGESAADVEAEKTVAEPQIIRETIIIEKEIVVEVTPVEVPQTVDGSACESFQNNITTALQERLVVLDTFQKAGDEAVAATADVKRASQQNIKAGVKELRDINKKNTAGFQCSAEHLRSMASAVKGLDDVVIAQARQNLAIMKKEEKVQPQYFGIRQDITVIENALKRIPDEKRMEMETQIQYFEQCKKDFDELVLGEGLILASEIQETAAQCKTAKTQIATLLKAKSSQPKVLKKETSVKKASLKKKLAKKSLKKKTDKKSKKTKKVKSKKNKK